MLISFTMNGTPECVDLPPRKLLASPDSCYLSLCVPAFKTKQSAGSYTDQDPSPFISNAMLKMKAFQAMLCTYKVVMPNRYNLLHKGI